MPTKLSRPLDSAALERLALRYVERFATSRARLVRYLERKVRERGWAGDSPPLPGEMADRLVALGYVDDRAYAEARGRTMARRGLGGRRLDQALAADGIDADLRRHVDAGHDDWQAALALARRRRLGPWGSGDADPKARDRAMGVFLRAGHRPAVARAILDAADEEALIPPD